jgi:hypothetical protein
MRPGFRLAGISSFLVLLSTCASTPAQMYEGPPLPRDQVALVTVEHAFNVDIIAIDGRRVRGSSWYVTPGWHDVWIRLNVVSGSEGTKSRVWSYCLIRLEADAGGTHRVEADRGDTREERSGFDKGLFDVEAGREDRGMTCSRTRPELTSGPTETLAGATAEPSALSTPEPEPCAPLRGVARRS